MKSPRPRHALAAAVLMAVLPSAHAWTRIACDLSGTVANPPVQMRQYRTDGADMAAVRKGKALKLRYRYDESLGEARATRFELAR